MSLNFVTLVLDLYDGQENPVQAGNVTLAPNAVVTDAADHVVVTQAPIVVKLFANPLPSVKLLATDNGSLTPSGWAWHIQPQFPGAPAGDLYQIPFSGGATQYLSQLIPAVGPPSISTPIPVTGTPSAGQVVTATSATTADWETPSGGGGGIAPPAGDIGGTAGSPTVVATHLASALPLAQGGTGQTARQAALNALAGTQVSGRVLRSDGTNTSLAAIASGDLPAASGGDLSGTLTSATVAKIQGTTVSSPPGGTTQFLRGDGSWQVPPGSGGGGIAPPVGDIGGSVGAPTVVATHLSSPLPVAQGGTSAATQQAAINALTGTQGSGKYLRSDGTNASLAVIQAADLPGPSDWLNVVTQYGADRTGATDCAAAINAAITAATAGQVVYLPAGKYKIASPIVVQKNGVTIRGAHGATASGNDAQFDLGTVITVSSSFTNPAYSAYATAAILLISTAPGAGSGGSGSATTIYGIRVSDLWIDGNGGAASVDGIAQYGSVYSTQFVSVGCYKVTGNAFPQYLDASYGTNNFPDGQHFLSCLAQVTTGHGFYGAFTDAEFADCHAQQGLGDGFYLLTGGNTRLVGCRADLNVNGFTLDTPRSNTSTSYNDCTTLTGCGSQGNNHNGLNVINSSATGTALRQTVVCSGCTFDGDGQNSGSGGGGYAGISVSGRNIVILDATTVLVATQWATGGSPQYGLSTATSGTSSVAPTSITWSSGAVNAQTALIHDAAPAIDLQVSPLVLGVAGGIMGSATARPFYSRGTSDWVNVCDPHYGADPAGTADSTAAIAKAITDAGTGTVYLPAGTYLISSPLTISTGLTITGAGKKATTITSTAASSIFAFSANAFWWAVSDLTAVNSGGHIFAGSHNLSAFRVERVSLQCNSNSSSIWAQSSGALIEAYFSLCDLSSGGSAPATPAFSLTDTTGSFNANVFEKCVCTFQATPTAYFFNWACTNAGEFSFANVWRDVVFEQCPAGAIFGQGHLRATLENVQLWDSNNLTAATTADLIHFGKNASGLSSRGVTIRGCSRENSTLGASLYDLSFDSTTVQASVDGFRASPDNAAVNFGGCQGAITSQSAGTVIAGGTAIPSFLTGTGNPNTVAVWAARVGDLFQDQAATSGNALWRCTTAGTPGTWAAAASAGGGISPPAGDIGGTTGTPTVVATHLSSPLPVAQGGTSGGTQQAAINALTGTQTAGRYLRSDGTNAALAAIQAADVPTLNQATTGTAAGLSATLAVGSGGSGHASLTAYAPLVGGTTSTGALQQVSASGATAGQLLTYQGPAALPTWTTVSGGGSADVMPAWNVMDHGAAGDGTTVDSTAVQATVALALAAGGGIVFFPAGTYVISGVTFGNNLIIQGAGQGATILLMNPAAATGAVVCRVAPPSSSVTTTNVHLRDLTIDGNKAVWGTTSPQKGYGYYLGQSTNGLISNCSLRSVEIRNCLTYAFDVERAQYTTLIDCTAHDNGYAGSAQPDKNCDGFTLIGDDITAIGCRAWNNAVNGFRGGQSSALWHRVQMTSCEAWSNSGDGASMGADATPGDGLLDSAITGGAFHSNGGRGIYLSAGCTSSSVSGASSYNNAANGILTAGASYCSVTGCNVNNNATGGSSNPEIYLSATSLNCSVTGNTVVSANATSAIAEATGGATDYSVITGNVVTSVGSPAIVTHGAHTVSAANTGWSVPAPAGAAIWVPSDATGATDMTTELQAFRLANLGELVKVADGSTILLKNCFSGVTSGDILLDFSNCTILYDHSTAADYAILCDNTAGASAEVSVSSMTMATVNTDATVTQVTLGTTLTAKRFDWIALYSTDANPAISGGQYGEIFQLLADEASLVLTATRKLNNYGFYATSVKARKLDATRRVYIRGGIVKASGNTEDHSITARAGGILIQGFVDPVAENITFDHPWAACLRFQATAGARARDITVRDVGNLATYNGFTYGVYWYGMNDCGDARNLVVRNGRHAATTTDGNSSGSATWYNKGIPTNLLIQGVHGYNCHGSVIDTHEEGDSIAFDGIWDWYPYQDADISPNFTGLGVQVRASNVTIRNFNVYGGTRGIKVLAVEHGFEDTVTLQGISISRTTQTATTDGDTGVTIDDQSGLTHKRHVLFDGAMNDVGMGFFVGKTAKLTISSLSLRRSDTIMDANAGSQVTFSGHAEFDYRGDARTAPYLGILCRSDSPNGGCSVVFLDEPKVILGTVATPAYLLFESDTTASKPVYVPGLILFNPSAVTATAVTNPAATSFTAAAVTDSGAGGGGGISPPAGDIGGTTSSPTVVATHLSSPLPLAQGGTNATSASAALTSLGALPVAGGTMTGALAMGAHKVTGLSSGTAATDAAAYGQIPAVWGPADQGFIAWNYDAPAAAAGSNLALTTAGTVYTIAIPLRQAASITSITMWVAALGATLTSGQCFAALYQGAGGALLGVTADQSAIWASPGSIGLKTMTLSGGPFAAAAGIVQVAVWFNGTTGPSFLRTDATAQVMNAGLATASNRWGAANTGVTTTGPGTLGTVTGSAPAAIWAALS